MVQKNVTIFRAKQVDSFKFGSTAWTEAQMASTTNALDTTFATNNATALLDLVGEASVGTANPGDSAPFAKNFSITGNELTVSEDNLLGSNSVGAQNQEISENPASLFQCECVLVYRNNRPLSIFNKNTKAALVEMDNSESTTTGQLNIGMNNIRVIHVGSLQRNAEGNMEQTLRFSFRGGESGTPITVTQSAPEETWDKVRAGVDYAEECRTA